MTEEKGIYESAVFAPQSVVARSFQVLDERANSTHAGVKSGIPDLDRVLIPFRPGELVTVLGYTSNGKSLLMNYITRNHAKDIQARKEAGKKIAVYITYEQAIEEQGLGDMAQIAQIDVSRMMRGELGAGDWRKLRGAGVQRGSLPLWLIGHSITQRDRRPHLSIPELWSALEFIVDFQKVEIELLAVDYLQRISKDKNSKERDRRGMFVEIVDNLKDLAIGFNVPVLLGCQAGRQVQDRGWKLPGKDDAQETSNAEQSSDKMISCWMPKNDYPIGHEIEYGDTGRVIEVTEELMICGIIKQKFGKSPRIFELDIDPAHGEISGLGRPPINTGKFDLTWQQDEKSDNAATEYLRNQRGEE